MKTGRDLPVLAVDIGGTKMLLGLFDRPGRIKFRDLQPTLAPEGPRAVIERLQAAIKNILERNGLSPAQLGGIGIACAGGIDTRRGVVVTPSPNLPGWKDIPLQELLQHEFATGIWLLNDASAAALGEQLFGAARGGRNVVLLTLGTGIGGGIIADGRLYLGAVGGAGELGHMTVDVDGPLCGCGNRGCLEMFASGSAISRDVIERIRRGERSAIIDLVGGNLESITTEKVTEAARKGDRLANDVISRAAAYLGIGMVNVVNIFNPEVIVIGGGMAAMGDLIIGAGRRLIKERAFSVSSRVVRVVTAALGNDAGIYGAAAFAWDQSGRRENEGS